MADTNRCMASLGDVPCLVPRSNRRHMRVPEEHSNRGIQWDDDAPGAVPHPVSAEVAHYRRVVASLRTHVVFAGATADGWCAGCDAEGAAGVPYPCATLVDAGIRE